MGWGSAHGVFLFLRVSHCPYWTKTVMVILSPPQHTHVPRLIPLITSNCTSKSVSVRRWVTLLTLLLLWKIDKHIVYAALELVEFSICSIWPFTLGRDALEVVATCCCSLPAQFECTFCKSLWMKASAKWLMFEDNVQELLFVWLVVNQFFCLFCCLTISLKTENILKS